MLSSPAPVKKTARPKRIAPPQRETHGEKQRPMFYTDSADWRSVGSFSSSLATATAGEDRAEHFARSPAGATRQTVFRIRNLSPGGEARVLTDNVPPPNWDP